MSSFLRKGGLWVVVQNVLSLAVLAAGPLFNGQRWAWGWRGLGFALCLSGAAFGVAGVRALGRNRSPFPRPVDDHSLVQAGIYRFVRHPLYSSLIFLSFGWALVWSSGATLALGAGLAAVLDRKARLEERWLGEKYPDYSGYRRRAARLIPWIY